MTVNDRFGTKETTFVSWTPGRADDALIEFTSPEEKGQKILRTRDEIYLFYPDAEELIRLQGAAFRDAVLGSDMSYEDLTGGKTILELYEVSLEGRETVDGAECWRVGDEGEGPGTSHTRGRSLWVDRALWSPRRMQQFSLAGRLLKEIAPRLISSRSPGGPSPCEGRAGGQAQEGLPHRVRRRGHRRWASPSIPRSFRWRG